MHHHRFSTHHIPDHLREKEAVRVATRYQLSDAERAQLARMSPVELGNKIENDLRVIMAEMDTQEVYDNREAVEDLKGMIVRLGRTPVEERAVQISQIKSKLQELKNPLVENYYRRMGSFYGYGGPGYGGYHPQGYGAPLVRLRRHRPYGRRWYGGYYPYYQGYYW